MQMDLFGQPEAYTVSDLTRTIREMLETDYRLQDVWVQGEVSNLSRPGSGHVYFSLKDAGAQIRCVIWRSTAQQMTVALREGEAIVAHGRVSVYEQQGNYQLYVDAVQSAGGIGDLYRQFELLKAKLQAEGLFDDERKRPLPELPRRIGIVTSPTGAAIRDTLNVISRRWPLLEVILAPTHAQGDQPPPRPPPARPGDPRHAQRHPPALALAGSPPRPATGAGRRRAAADRRRAQAAVRHARPGCHHRRARRRLDRGPVGLQRRARRAGDRRRAHAGRLRRGSRDRFHDRRLRRRRARADALGCGRAGHTQSRRLSADGRRLCCAVEGAAARPPGRGALGAGDARARAAAPLAADTNSDDPRASLRSDRNARNGASAHRRAMARAGRRPGGAPERARPAGRARTWVRDRDAHENRRYRAQRDTSEFGRQVESARHRWGVCGAGRVSKLEKGEGTLP